MLFAVEEKYSYNNKTYPHLHCMIHTFLPRHTPVTIDASFGHLFSDVMKVR